MTIHLQAALTRPLVLAAAFVALSLAATSAAAQCALPQNQSYGVCRTEGKIKCNPPAGGFCYTFRSHADVECRCATQNPNHQIRGDVKETIQGDRGVTIQGDQGHTIQGDRSHTVAGQTSREGWLQCLIGCGDRYYACLRGSKTPLGDEACARGRQQCELDCSQKHRR
jgi:hypothetical protein